jgi:hypothetical protein
VSSKDVELIVIRGYRHEPGILERPPHLALPHRPSPYAVHEDHDGVFDTQLPDAGGHLFHQIACTVPDNIHSESALFSFYQLVNGQGHSLDAVGFPYQPTVIFPIVPIRNADEHSGCAALLLREFDAKDLDVARQRKHDENVVVGKI